MIFSRHMSDEQFSVFMDKVNKHQSQQNKEMREKVQEFLDSLLQATVQHGRLRYSGYTSITDSPVYTAIVEAASKAGHEHLRLAEQGYDRQRQSLSTDEKFLDEIVARINRKRIEV